MEIKLGMQMKEKKIYMGCGNDFKEDFLHADIRNLPNVDIVCKAWELSQHEIEVDYIYSRHMLEHLTNYEADRTLRDWYKSLKYNGEIEVIVPDMDFHAKQWLDAEWNDEVVKDKWSDAKHSFAGFWGWQEECDPWTQSYNDSYWSVHKSGYNKKRMLWLLERIGYEVINVQVIDKWHLVAKARKPKDLAERQTGESLESIRKDHVQRYEFASTLINKENAIVTDAACGVGYGSFILSQNNNVKAINSMDISTDALSHAKEHFDNSKISFMQKNLEKEAFNIESSDYFISFETIEHLNGYEKFIKKIYDNLKEGGVFVGSTPNEKILPFNQQYFLYHVRHFEEQDIEEILLRCGFKNIEFYQQRREEPSLVEKIDNGHYIVFTCEK